MSIARATPAGLVEQQRRRRRAPSRCIGPARTPPHPCSTRPGRRRADRGWRRSRVDHRPIPSREIDTDHGRGRRPRSVSTHPRPGTASRLSINVHHHRRTGPDRCRVRITLTAHSTSRRTNVALIGGCAGAPVTPARRRAARSPGCSTRPRGTRRQDRRGGSRLNRDLRSEDVVAGEILAARAEVSAAGAAPSLHRAARVSVGAVWSSIHDRGIVRGRVARDHHAGWMAQEHGLAGALMAPERAAAAHHQVVEVILVAVVPGVAATLR